MFSFKRLMVIGAVIMSILYVAGCSSGQTTYQDQGTAQPEYSQSSSQASYQDIDAAQAKQLLDNDKTVQLIDVREDFEYAQGHIPGAKLIPLSQFTSRIGEIDKTKPVLLYCSVSSRSPSAAQVLVQSGYTNVYNLSGGLAQWPYDIE